MTSAVRFAERSKKVVVLDDDRDIAELVQAILIDEGFLVSCLYEREDADVSAAIVALSPDCVLLDGSRAGDFGQSWSIATWLHARTPPIPVIMLTAHAGAREEAVRDLSTRARAAGIGGVVAKPFDIDRLVAAVRQAIGFDSGASPASEESHHRELVDRLRAAGAQELMTSNLGREWATFRVGPERLLYKVYRWRAADVYFVGRYSFAGDQLEPLGQFYDLDALVVYCASEIKRSPQ